MPSADVNGRLIRYTDTGGDGPCVVLSHGFFLDHSVFAPQIEELGASYRIIAWDARGHGGTVDDGVPFTYWDSAGDLVALLDHLEIDQAVLGGVSQGGFISLRAALLAPARVAGLILCDTEATACDPGDQIGYRQLFDALRAHGPVEDITVPLSTQLLGDNHHAAAWRERWPQVTLPLGAPADCLLGRDDVLDRLSEITCPALLIWGSKDVSLPRNRMDALQAGLASATAVQVIEGAAHTPPLTHPEIVNPLLTDFLQRSLTQAG
ncbi:alpha/beta hydrolase [Pseudonocardiaceae bacterium YIM PH 21723]|nr:alpha/beta hydrolase [Pseudonocardiaceae bacterium YIM PH 21723]